MNRLKQPIYPFTAIVGQERMKEALILNIINPRIGGILIRGEKGTAKSTAVRSLVDLLPEISAVQGCRYNCDPFDIEHLCDECRTHISDGKNNNIIHKKIPLIELPISATEDRVVGSLDFEYAVKQGKCRFEPGLLAAANRGIIYVDEVNLLDDHIVDVLLDTASTGINIVERENVSFSHAARFILVGTMNPEEGGLRPQLLDRFGLCVEVKAVNDPLKRVEIVKRREEFDNDPQSFINKYYSDEQNLKIKIVQARKFFNEVCIDNVMFRYIAKLCIDALVSGHRADIVMEETSRSIAAYHGHRKVQKEDADEAAEMVLLHRKNNAVPPDQHQNKQDDKENNNKQNKEEKQKHEKHENDREQHLNKNNESLKGNNYKNNRSSDKDQDGENNSESEGNKDYVFSIGKPFQVKSIKNKRDRMLRKGSGRRSHTKTSSKLGRYIKSTMAQNNDPALDATLRAAAPYQLFRSHKDTAVAIESSDMRYKIREKRIGNFLLFAVDGSGSMGAQKRMTETKGAILSILLDAYQKRDKVGMITFRKETAEITLPPTNSVELAYKLLEKMPTGGKTPLSSGLYKSYMLAKAQLIRDPNISPILIIISDCKGNVSMGKDKPLKEAAEIAERIRDEEKIRVIVIDVEKDGLVTFGLAKKLSDDIGGKYFKIDDLKADKLIKAIKEVI